MAEFRIETERLILREWRDDDLAPFAAMCADPAVMATLGPLKTRGETAALIARVKAIGDECGHTMWAVERVTDSRFIGWCGLIPGVFWPLLSKVEVGWRIATDCWGHGYAREAAEASLDWAFTNLADERVWAITTPGNTRSWGLMERLGMKRHPELDFDHPNVPDGTPLKRHITYSIGRDEWPKTR